VADITNCREYGIPELLDKIRQSAETIIIFSVHAVDEMNAPDEMISTQEVREVVFKGVTIEDYPQDRRGHSALLGAETSLCRVVHIVCAPKDGYLAIITAYVPSLEKWEEGLMKRRKR
jgi:hypothetical protein